MKNFMKMSLPCKEENQEVIVAAVVAFVEQLDTTVEELDAIKTAVMEATDNIIIFAYPERKDNIYIYCKLLKDNVISIFIKDKGVGIKDVEEARQPLFSTKPPRAGLGITIMETFMDTKITSIVGKGTTVNLKRCIGKPFKSYNLKD